MAWRSGNEMRRRKVIALVTIELMWKHVRGCDDYCCRANYGFHCRSIYLKPCVGPVSASPSCSLRLQLLR